MPAAELGPASGLGASSAGLKAQQSYGGRPDSCGAIAHFPSPWSRRAPLVPKLEEDRSCQRFLGPYSSFRSGHGSGSTPRVFFPGAFRRSYKRPDRRLAFNGPRKPCWRTGSDPVAGFADARGIRAALPPHWQSATATAGRPGGLGFRFSAEQ